MPILTILNFRLTFPKINEQGFIQNLINSFICFCDLCYSYHATAALEEAQKLARQKIPSAAALQLHSFTFDDFGLENDEMLQVTKKSFTVHPHLAFSLNYVGVEGLN